MLVIDRLCKTYPNGVQALKDVSLSIGAGMFGLLGPNGAGKTTSFRMTIGMIRADAGEVDFLGREVNRLPMYRRARLGMGYLSQEPSIFRNLTGCGPRWASASSASFWKAGPAP